MATSCKSDQVSPANVETSESPAGRVKHDINGALLDPKRNSQKAGPHLAVSGWVEVCGEVIGSSLWTGTVAPRKALPKGWAHLLNCGPLHPDLTA